MEIECVGIRAWVAEMNRCDPVPILGWVMMMVEAMDDDVMDDGIGGDLVGAVWKG